MNAEAIKRLESQMQAELPGRKVSLRPYPEGNLVTGNVILWPAAGSDIAYTRKLRPRPESELEREAWIAFGGALTHLDAREAVGQ